LGCALHGCCFGSRSDLPWAVSLPPGSSAFLTQAEQRLIPPAAGASLPVHPLPLYFSAVALLIAALALWMGASKRYEGRRALWFLVLFSASSAVLEPLRADDPFRVYWGPLPQLLWVSAGMAVVFLAVLTVVERRAWRARQAAAARRMHVGRNSPHCPALTPESEPFELAIDSLPVPASG
jgi:phosphatidylglycerol:prolipoprotein diacylglycerol transferase